MLGIQVKLGIPDGNRAGSNFEIFGHDVMITSSTVEFFL